MLILAMALATASPENENALASCYRPQAGEVLLQQGELEISPYGNRERFRIATVATKRAGEAQTFGVSQSDLYIWDGQCELAYRQTFREAPLVRFEEARLGNTVLLHVIAQYPGGSDIGFRHTLLKLDPLFDVQSLAPMPLFHNTMGGFFVGPLGGGRGDGIALWGARWESGAHYDPHPADMTIYRWVDGAFTGPERLSTERPVAAEANAAPAALGFDFQDSTRPDLFYSDEALSDAASVPG